MYKKLCLLTCFVVFISIANIATALDNPLAYYPMDEGAGTTVADESGNGNDGTIVGSLDWVEGAPDFGMGLDFPATAGNYVNCGTFNPSGTDDIMTVSAWFKIETLGGYQCIVGKAVAESAGAVQWQLTVTANGAVGAKINNSGFTTITANNAVAAGEWYHVALVKNGTEGQLYLNGETAGDPLTGLTALGEAGYEYPVMIGVVRSFLFNGVIDEVAIFDIALSQDDVKEAMEGIKSEKGPATSPKPANGAKNVTSNNPTLSWKSGPFAYTHNVYFGTDFNDVNESSVDMLKGDTVLSADQAVDANSYYPGKLEYGTKYYWRVDEANEAPDNTVFKGKIWSFTTEPEGYDLTADNIKGVVASDVTPLNEAQDPNTTYDGTGLTVDEVNDISTHDNDVTTMWAGMGSESGDVWLMYELDQIYKLHELKIWNYNETEPYSLFAAKDVNVLYSIDNETWMALDELQVFDIAPGTDDYSNYEVVDMNGAVAKYVKLVFVTSYAGDGVSAGGISEIIFSVIPTRVSNPTPENDSEDVDFNSVLTWDTGRGFGIHKIYIGSDKSSVMNGTSDIIDETEDASYEITLGLGQTYYWKVDEVNDAEDYTTWDGPIWKFSTQDFIVVDNFEVGYKDDDVNAVYLTWLDGESYGDDNGSWMGRDDAPYLQTISRNGRYSAPMQYENDYYSYSEVRAETSKLAQIGSDWSLGNPNTLEIWFRADSNDVNEPVADILYAIINDGDKIYYDGDVADIRKDSWTKFAVPLDGINLSNVTSIAIGVEPIDASEGGDVGTLYFDDIQLAVSVEQVNPTDANLILWYEMEDNVLDSSDSGFDGDPNNGNLGNGGLTYEEGKFGKALVFDGNDDYVTLPIGQTIPTLTSCTISTWVKYAGGDGWQKVFDFGTGEDVYMDLSANNTQGSIRCSITTQSYQNEDGINAPSILAVGYWEHIVIVFDKENGFMKLYRNGDLAGTDDEMNTYPEDLGETDKNWLGRSVWADNPFFNGMIDDFRIYDRALSAGEVKYLYKN